MSWVMTDGNYPKQESWEVITPKFVYEPIPNGLFITNNNYPMFTTWQLDTVPSTPLPEGLFVTQNNYPMFETWELSYLGAFNDTSLENVKIPNTTVSIGKYSFRNTDIESVKLPNNCTYYSTSFSEDCNVEGGNVIE